MSTAALVLAVLALVLALAAKAKANSFARELEDVRADSRRRAEGLAEEVEGQLGLMREMLAQVADGGGLTGRMIRDGQLWRDVMPQEAVEMVEKEAPRLIDVRTPHETAMGIIPGALLIPIDELEERASEIPSDGKPTLIVCAGGGRSAAACEFLSSRGHSNLNNLVGGMGAWTGKVEKPQ